MRPPRISPTGYRRIVVAALASLVLIMVTGAAVRLTGSGLGCSTWPTCEADSFTPRSASDVHGMVEWVNRLITGVLMLFTVAAVLGARWRRPFRPDLYRWSLGLPAWVVANALVGALVVWLELSPVSVIGHFLLSIGSVWNAVVLLERASLPDPDTGPAPSGAAAPPAPPARRELATPRLVALCRALLVAAAAVVVTGTLVTGSGPHAGDERADRLDLVVGDVVRVHGITMVVFLALTVAAARRAHRGDAGDAVGQRLHTLLVVLVGQAAIGYWQYFTGVPALLVGFHVFGAACVWIAVLRVWLAVRPPVVAPATAGAARTPSAEPATV
ncbi:MAG TPA: COX15/CtaA family protein [Acidimicrobiales bacterium]|nr:COX15/CtaA family protein [Acidimicrobiales bacterium]